MSTITYLPHRHCSDLDIRKLPIGTKAECDCGKFFELRVMVAPGLPVIRRWSDSTRRE